MKKVAYLLLVFLSASCVEKAQEVNQNGNFKVELLFEQNGCKVYRFEDGSHYVYWADCPGKVQYDKTTVSGKTVVTDHVESFTTTK